MTLKFTAIFAKKLIIDNEKNEVEITTNHVFFFAISQIWIGCWFNVTRRDISIGISLPSKSGTRYRSGAE